MIIDATDSLYTGRFSAFCCVSSDNDLTRLAARIREQGVTVYGFGRRDTPSPFVAACDRFVFSDALTAPIDLPAGPVLTNHTISSSLKRAEPPAGAEIRAQKIPHLARPRKYLNMKHLKC